jgi:DnaJ domain
MGLNPITNENGYSVPLTYNLGILTGMVGATTAHYLGNRFIWRWYSDSQILAMHVPMALANVGVQRIVSNIFPGKITTFEWMVKGEDGEERPVPISVQTQSNPTTLAALVMTFAPMVLLPAMGVPRVGFWGCFLGFTFHTVVTSIPVAIAGTFAAIAGVFVAVWTGAIKPPRPTGHYETLGVDPKASVQEIKRAYHKLALKAHPDKCNGSEEEKAEATERFKPIANAYQVLSDPEKKQKYDRFGIDGQQSMTDWKTIVCALVFIATNWAFGKKAEESASSTGQGETF